MARMCAPFIATQDNRAADMDLVAIARNPIPSGAVTGTFPGYDGHPIRYAHWAATRGPRRGTVCCFTGRTEFIEKYFEVVADLRRRGFAVAMIDWRGQGGSYRAIPGNRNKGYIRDFSEYDRDLAIFMRDVVLPDCPPPYTALAHSMGAHILIRNAGVQGSWFDRMVLVAPMLELHRRNVGAPNWLARTTAIVATSLGFGWQFVPGGTADPAGRDTFETNTLTSDRERWMRHNLLLKEAPELGLGSPTYGWLAAAYRSMAMLATPSFAANVKVPMLVFVAGHDTIVSPRAIEDFATRLKLGTHVILPTARHEILQEADETRTRFWAAFDAYLGIDSAVVK